MKGRITCFVFLLISFFTLLSCTQSKTQYKTVPANPKKVNDAQFMIGWWMIVAKEELRSDNRAVPGQCNSCPVIIFDKDYSGNLKTEGGSLIYSFSWLIKNNQLSIQQKNNAVTNPTIEGVYKIVYPGNKLIHKMNLIDSVKKVEYFLN